MPVADVLRGLRRASIGRRGARIALAITLGILGVLAAPASPLSAQATAEDEYILGEAAFRAGDTAAAEAHFRKALDGEPGHVRALARLATVVSWDDKRLSESRTMFEKAVSIDPLSTDARLGLARVCSWMSDFDCALSTYGALRRENPGNREASLGLARTQGWAGNNRDARSTYLEILSDNPGDIDARNGLSAVLSWDGRLDDSLALYEETLSIEPANRDALAGRARVLHWQGRTGEARDALDAALAANPGNREALKLDLTMREAMSPSLEASAGVVHDNDKNAYNAQRIAWSQPVDARRAMGVSYDRYEAAIPPIGLAGKHETLRGFGSLRARRHIGFAGSAGFDQITHEKGDRTIHPVFAASADYRLNDRFSFYGGVSRETLTSTARSLDHGIRLTSGSAGASWQALPRLTARASLEQANFTDGNQRDLRSASVRWAVPLRRPRLGLSLAERYLSFDRSAFDDADYARVSGGSYFSPRSYLASTLAADLSDRIGRRIGWNLLLTRGWQRVFSGETNPVTGYHAAASYDFDRAITVEGYIGRTNLAIAMGSGFRSTEAGFRLRWRIAENKTGETGK